VPIATDRIANQSRASVRSAENIRTIRARPQQPSPQRSRVNHPQTPPAPALPEMMRRISPDRASIYPQTARACANAGSSPNHWRRNKRPAGTAWRAGITQSSPALAAEKLFATPVSPNETGISSARRRPRIRVTRSRASFRVPNARNAEVSPPRERT